MFEKWILTLKFVIVSLIVCFLVIEWIEVRCLKIEGQRSMRKELNTSLILHYNIAQKQSVIRCPCMRCGNLIHHTPTKIR